MDSRQTAPGTAPASAHLLPPAAGVAGVTGGGRGHAGTQQRRVVPRGEAPRSTTRITVWYCPGAARAPDGGSGQSVSAPPAARRALQPASPPHPQEMAAPSSACAARLMASGLAVQAVMNIPEVTVVHRKQAMRVKEPILRSVPAAESEPAAQGAGGGRAEEQRSGTEPSSVRRRAGSAQAVGQAAGSRQQAVRGSGGSRGRTARDAEGFGDGQHQAAGAGGDRGDGGRQQRLCPHQRVGQALRWGMGMGRSSGGVCVCAKCTDMPGSGGKVQSCGKTRINQGCRRCYPPVWYCRTARLWCMRSGRPAPSA